MWDQRFSGVDYHFGTEPAAFLRRAAAAFSPGSRILCLADGEGRNSVYLATLGHQVTAMEASPVGIKKAQALAEAKGVDVHFEQADIAQWDWDTAQWDIVAGIFIQFAPPPLRAQIHAGIKRAVAPGGLVVLHGYAPRQVAYGTGGPGREDHMYRLDELRTDFVGWQQLHAEDYDAEITEGRGHRGRSALVEFIARRPGGPNELQGNKGDSEG